MTPARPPEPCVVNAGSRALHRLRHHARGVALVVALTHPWGADKIPPPQDRLVRAPRLAPLRRRARPGQTGQDGRQPGREPPLLTRRTGASLCCAGRCPLPIAAASRDCVASDRSAPRSRRQHIAFCVLPLQADVRCPVLSSQVGPNSAHDLSGAGDAAVRIRHVLPNMTSSHCLRTSLRMLGRCGTVPV